MVNADSQRRIYTKKIAIKWRFEYESTASCLFTQIQEYSCIVGSDVRIHEYLTLPVSFADTWRVMQYDTSDRNLKWCSDVTENRALLKVYQVKFIVNCCRLHVSGCVCSTVASFNNKKRCNQPRLPLRDQTSVLECNCVCRPCPLRLRLLSLLSSPSLCLLFRTVGSL